jgi:hypothetical protein
MKLPTRYLQSQCKGDWLHRFLTIESRYEGAVERCERCGTIKYFPKEIPNYEYIKYHVREILQSSDPLFIHEYPNAIT